MKWQCPNCGFIVNNAKLPVYCICGSKSEVPTNDIEAICKGCKYRVPKGCALYIRPCTVKQLWKDQVPPPEKCPNKEKFYE